MSRLTWVQPSDLLAHELVASAQEGKAVDDVAERWRAAGGSTSAPVGGAGPAAGAALTALARQLLDELDARPVDPTWAASEPDGLADLEQVWSAPLPVGVDQAVGPGRVDLSDRVLGAWSGRAAGCLLGKPVEKLPRHAIRAILQSQGRWPLDDWFTAVGLPDEVADRWPWNRRSAPTSLAENITSMPEDDDLNFAMLALALVEQHGDALATDDVATAWLDNLPGGRVFTAERVAYRNLLLGETAPRTATRHNPFRDWIGAWIRADAYGWTRPGDPVAAARLAWQDARLSHVRAGLHGALFVAATCSAAVVADGPADVEAVLRTGLAVVPPQGRLAEAVRLGMGLGRSGQPTETALDALHAAYGHLHWVHVLNNAALVAYALVAGEARFERSVPIAVMGGWDTDSAGATVGSICGALGGRRALPARWIDPLRNRVASSLPGFDAIGLDALAARTVACTPERVLAP